MLGAASAALPSTWQRGTGRSSTGWVSSTSKLMSVLSDSLKICSEKVDCCCLRRSPDHGTVDVDVVVVLVGGTTLIFDFFQDTEIFIK